MTPDSAAQLIRDMFMMAFWLSAPLLAIGFVAWQWPRQAVPSLNVATLAQAVDAVWVDASFAPQPGRALKAGWLRCPKG